MKKMRARDGMPPFRLINNQIAELEDWRGKMLARLRKLILKTAPALRKNGSGVPRYGLKTGLFAVPVLSRVM
jgi:hypothetical protein